MELTYYQVLEFLMANNGLNKMISIEPLITMAIPHAPTFDEFLHTAMKPINKVLFKLSEDSNIIIGSHPSPNGSSYDWDMAKIIMVELTQKGESTIKERLLHESSLRLNDSTYETNESVKNANESVVKTGESVMLTNKALVDNAADQLLINNRLADNAIYQTKIINRQTLIFYFTAAFALGSLSISLATFLRDNSKEQLQTKLIQQSKEIHILKLQIVQLKRDSLKNTTNYKTSPKVN